MKSAAEIIATLALAPHPEGGWYRQTWVAAAPEGERPAGTAIYYLLEKGQRSHWHRVDAVETWHWYAGAPMRLCYWDGAAYVKYSLSGRLAELSASADKNSALAIDGWQATVPVGMWQGGQPECSALTPDWSLIGCTVSPGFRFEGFELAAPDWAPGTGAYADVDPFD